MTAHDSNPAGAHDVIIGLEVHAQLRDREQDVLRLFRQLRRPAEHAHLPDLPRAAGRAAGAERARPSISR
ncbi:MAG: hypothetical protein MZW92_53710 [Comamonadaceae bacterium]|nr:hypothetical protein [Comamonadaceae bacterium]